MPARIASLTGMSSHLRIRAFCRRIARGVASSSASSHSATAASSSASGTTRSTRPQRAASSASYTSPSSSSWRVRPQPTRPGSRAASTTDGMPRRTSGMPKRADAAAIRRSQAATSSSPAPSVKPWMRAITGTGRRRTASQQRCTRVMNARPPPGSVIAPISSMSAPPTKAFGPAPVRTTARSASSAASCSNTATKASITAAFMVFRRRSLSIVTRATRPPSPLCSNSSLTRRASPETIVHSRSCATPVRQGRPARAPLPESPCRSVAPRRPGAPEAIYHGPQRQSPTAIEGSDMNDALHTIAPERIREHVGEAEWSARVQLAAVYRLLHRYGMTDLIYNHATLRVPGSDHILINAYGYLYNEVCASNLLKIDLEGRVVLAPEDPNGYGVNVAGYVIHSAIHRARPDVHCVIHTHTRAGMAVSAMADGLLPLTQTAMRFHGRIGYHEYESVAIDLDEQDRLVADLGHHDAMILRNHGLLAVGPSAAQAFNTMYWLEMACRAQVDA